MKNLGRLLLVFGILVFITLVGTIVGVQEGGGNSSAFVFMLIMLYGVGIEVAVLLVLGTVLLLKGRIFKRDPGKTPAMTASDIQENQDRRMQGKRYLLYAGLVLLIGFSLCLGGAYTFAEFYPK